MNIQQLREKLHKANLSALARLSGVPLRTLRRIKNGEGSALTETVERITPHLGKK